MQLFVSSLQLLNRVQMAAIWSTNLIFLIYFFSKAFESHEITIEEQGVSKRVKRRMIPQTLFRIKLLTQEFCIATITSIMLLFSLTEDTAFSSSRTYSILEDLILLFIIFAVISEFLWVIFQTIHQILDSRKKSKLQKLNTYYVLETQGADASKQILPGTTGIDQSAADKKLQNGKTKVKIEGDMGIEWWESLGHTDIHTQKNVSPDSSESRVKIYRRKLTNTDQS